MWRFSVRSLRTKRILNVLLAAVCLMLLHQSIQLVNLERRPSIGQRQYEDYERQLLVAIGQQRPGKDGDLSSSADVVDRPSHPLENLCKFPVLSPEDSDLRKYIQHGFRVRCNRTQPDLVQLLDNGQLQMDGQLAEAEFTFPVECYYRGLTGGYMPDNVEYKPLSDWTLLPPESPVAVDFDVIQCECYLNDLDDDQIGNRSRLIDRSMVFRNAFAQVVRRADKQFRPSDPNRLSLDILVIDSQSLNAFKRHAPRTWQYMTEEMGFFHFNGYIKVADNSMPNLMPLLTGLRYDNHSDLLLSQVKLDAPLESEQLPFLWRIFRDRNCATLFNDDIAHWQRGFMNYPRSQTQGFTIKPTEHFYRPWHLYHRRSPIANSSKFCFGNQPYYEQQLRLTEQMIKSYADTCHFSFNFLTELTHDDANKMEAIDEYLTSMLQRLNADKRYLNNTALVLMGDHGNRIGLIRYSYVGRIEERMPMFAIRFPDWFAERHPETVRNLRRNANRLVTHFDSHRMFVDILEGRLDPPKSAPIADDTGVNGISLFSPIDPDRNCQSAGVPINYCTCLIVNRTIPIEHPLLRTAQSILQNWLGNVTENLIDKTACDLHTSTVKILNATVYTSSQLVQHGVKSILDPKQLADMNKRWLDGTVEFLETELDFGVSRQIPAVARFHYSKKFNQLSLNIPPLFLADLSACLQ